MSVELKALDIPAKQLASMALHEVLIIEQDDSGCIIRVRRVPGGWLYEHFWPRTYTTDHPQLVTTFVPEPR